MTLVLFWDKQEYKGYGLIAVYRYAKLKGGQLEQVRNLSWENAPIGKFIPLGYQPTLAPEVTPGLGTSSPTEARQDSSLRGTGSIGKQQSQSKA